MLFARTNTDASPSFDPAEATRQSSRSAQNAWIIFRVYFAIHIFLESLKFGYAVDSTTARTLQAFCLLGVLLAPLRRAFWIGMLSLAFIRIAGIWYTFPMSANHAYFEALVLLALVFMTGDDGAKRERLWVTCLVLTVYFYSGLQKLIHGHWLDGEILLKSLFVDAKIGLWKSIDVVLEFLGLKHHAVDEVVPMSEWGLGASPMSLAPWALVLASCLGAIVVLAEIAVPLLYLTRRFRRLAGWLLLAMALAIGIISWEIEFMFGMLGCIVWMRSSQPKRALLSLLAVHVLWTVGVRLLGSRLGSI